jgi:hypothetical protein
LSSDKTLAEFLDSDYGYHLPVTFEKIFSPADLSISEEKIVETLCAELTLLTKVFTELLK